MIREQIAVLAQDGASPRDNIFGSLAARLMDEPEFQVLRPVVSSETVPVVDVFTRQQITPENLRHYKSMFRNVPLRSGHRVLGQKPVNVVIAFTNPASGLITRRVNAFAHMRTRPVTDGSLAVHVMPMNVTLRVASELPELRAAKLYDLRRSATTAGTDAGQCSSFLLGGLLANFLKHPFSVLRDSRPVTVRESYRPVLVVRLRDDFNSASALANVHTNTIAQQSTEKE